MQRAMQASPAYLVCDGLEFHASAVGRGGLCGPAPVVYAGNRVLSGIHVLTELRCPGLWALSRTKAKNGG